MREGTKESPEWQKESQAPSWPGSRLEIDTIAERQFMNTSLPCPLEALSIPGAKFYFDMFA